MQKITPFLWFDNNAEDAIKWYTSVFKNSKVLTVTHWGPGGPGPEGAVMTASIELEGQQFDLLNGGPQFKFTEAVSFVVSCATQDEVDYYWEKLSEGGMTQPCGWLKDRFGLSWQVVPSMLPELLKDKDPRKSQALMGALMKMSKLDIAQLQAAYDHA